MTIMSKIAWRSIRKQKTKTILVSFGILFSVMLLSVIVILFSSYKSSLISTIVKNKGDWHYFRQDNYNIASFDKNNELGECEQYTLLNEIGYSQIENPINDQKPYIHISSIKTTSSDMLEVKIMEGRLPENENELIIPMHYAKVYNIGVNDVLSFSLGNRVALDSSGILHQNSSYLGADKETIMNMFSKTFTIIGITESIGFIENSFSPGYSLLTYSVDDQYTRAYVKLANPNDCKKYIESHNENIVYNKDLLDILGITNGESSGSIYSIILLALGIIIFINCFLLIYNAFMLSINERTRDYSVYNSIGMTGKQMILSTLLENIIIALVMIPIGLLLSVVIVKSFLSTFVFIVNQMSYVDIVFKLSFNIILFIILFAVSFFMVVFSSIAPYILSKNKLGILGLKQNYTIKRSKHKANKKAFNRTKHQLVKKSLTRHKSKYISTIVSIVVSLTLFLSINIFCEYAIKQIDDNNITNYQIYCSSNKTMISNAIEDIYQPLSNIDGISNSWWVINEQVGYYKFKSNEVTLNAKDILNKDNRDEVDVNYIVLSELYYKELLRELGLNYNDYINMNNIKAIATAKVLDYDEQSTQYYNIFSSNEIIASFENDNIEITDIKLDLIQSDMPNSLKGYGFYNGINVFIPESLLNSFFKNEPSSIRFYFSCNDPSTAYNEMIIMQNSNNWNIDIINYSASYEKELGAVGIIQTFANIFTIVVIAIAILNICNTVFSTLIARKKEMAIFSSVGMEEKTLVRLILTENYIVYAIALAISTLISIFISVALKIAFKNGHFYFPWFVYIIINFVYFSLITICSLFAIRYNKKISIIQLIKDESL